MTVEVKVWRCKLKTNNASLKIEGKRLGTLKLAVESVCSCPCEDEMELNVARCNGGNRTCGVCSCRPDKTCGCGQGGLDERTCIAPGDMFVCSDRGTCICGKCHCTTTQGLIMSRWYSGEFCECSDFSCDYFQGQLCGGPTRGRCECGTCICNEGYDGSGCSFQLPPQSCKAENGRTCNDRGVCTDGVCRCFPPYWGPTCEDCSWCYRRCWLLEKCAECLAFATGQYVPTRCREKCSRYRLHMAGEWNGTSPDRISAEKMPCVGRDGRGCVYEFTYFYHDRILTFIVSRKHQMEVLGLFFISALNIFISKYFAVIARHFANPASQEGDERRCTSKPHEHNVASACESTPLPIQVFPRLKVQCRHTILRRSTNAVNTPNTHRRDLAQW
ncbi:integrin beta-1-B-like [Gigantopelta aegis]|uniref:integrin beta-1-B-like n=1 Tax=Gigantopelta aegis TaxID=1735272 RepID=UPI001B8879A8|nr:integrin beta-1-B-like [Gigantopelta aegis]